MQKRKRIIKNQIEEAIRFYKSLKVRMIFLILIIFLTNISFVKNGFPLTQSLQSSYEARQFSDSQTSSHFGLGMEFHSENSNLYYLSDQTRPQFELNLNGFYDLDSQKDWGVNLEPLVFRTQNIWIGKTHPLTEIKPNSLFSYRSAIGNQWVQERSQPLDPQLSGWVGLGTHIPFSSKLSISLMASPLFIPEMGPGIRFNEEGEVKDGARFSQLPPRQAQIDDATVPIRYQIETGPISKILLQPQAFGSLNWKQNNFLFQGIFWTAPHPSPNLESETYLILKENDAFAVAEIRPKFEREKFLSFRGAYEASDVQVLSELAHSMNSQQSIYSVAVKFKSLSVGWLNALKKSQGPDFADPAHVLYVAPYEEGLVWLQLEKDRLLKRIKAILKIEHHYVAAYQDLLIEPQIQYQFSQKIRAYAKGTLLGGKDYSYFGNWRNLDYVGLGLGVRL